MYLRPSLAVAACALSACVADEPNPSQTFPAVPCSCTVATYDADGELQTSMQQTYDDDGHLIREEGVTAVGWHLVSSWSYDGDLLVGRGTTIDGNADTSEWVVYEHDGQGRIVGALHEEGFLAGVEDRLTYNEHGLTGSVRVGPGGEDYGQTTFQWEGPRLTGWASRTDGTDTGGAIRTYDAPAPSLDHTEVRTYPNQDPQVSERRYGSSGELIERLEIGSSGQQTAWHYTYDSEGRTAEVAYDDSSNAAVVAYTYDGVGREVSRVSTVTAGSPIYGGRIERRWSCPDQAVVPTPQVPGIVAFTTEHPLYGRR